MLELLFNKVTGLEVCNFIKKRLQHRCFLVNIAKFLRTLILKTSANGCCSVLLIIKLVITASFLNQKHDVGWFLLRRFVDLFRLYSLLIIGGNHLTTFLLLDPQKNRSKVKNRSSDVIILTSLASLLSIT